MANGTFRYGNGTKDNPYIVEDLADLRAINSLTAAHTPSGFTLFFKQATHIDCQGHVFDRPFKCAGYDGNGKVLKNISMIVPYGTPYAPTQLDRPLNASLFYAGEYKNIKVINGYIQGTTASGLADGGEWDLLTSITHCSFEGTVEGVNHAAGMVHALYSESEDEKEFIMNSRFKGHVRLYNPEGNTIDSTSVSGIVGGMEHANIRNCHFKGTLTNPYHSENELGRGTMTAGVVLESFGTDLIERCTVKATIEAKGGMVGGIIARSFRNILVSKCQVEGTLSNQAGIAGGIIGYCYSELDSRGVIDQCSFKGSVSAYTRVGGIASDTYERSVISNCYTEADVVGTDEMVGGIASTIFDEVKLINCISSGTVQGSSYVTGITTAYGNEVPYTCKSLVSKITLISHTTQQDIEYGDVRGDEDFAEHTFSYNEPLDTDNLAKYRNDIVLVGCSHEAMDAANNGYDYYRKGTPIGIDELMKQTTYTGEDGTDGSGGTGGTGGGTGGGNDGVFDFTDTWEIIEGESVPQLKIVSPYEGQYSILTNFPSIRLKGNGESGGLFKVHANDASDRFLSVYDGGESHYYRGGYRYRTPEIKAGLVGKFLTETEEVGTFRDAWRQYRLAEREVAPIKLANETPFIHAVFFEENPSAYPTSADPTTGLNHEIKFVPVNHESASKTLVVTKKGVMALVDSAELT